MMIGPVVGSTAGLMAKEPTAALAKGSAPVDAVKGIGTFIKEVAEGQEKMAIAMREAFSGRKLSGTEMLAVQAGIYRFSAELDLAARLVEKLSSGVKQAMNTQVG